MNNIREIEDWVDGANDTQLENLLFYVLNSSVEAQSLALEYVRQ